MTYYRDVVPPYITDDWIIFSIIQAPIKDNDDDQTITLVMSAWEANDKENSTTFCVLASRKKLVHQCSPTDSQSTDTLQAEDAVQLLEHQLNKKTIADFKKLPLFDEACFLHTMEAL